MAEVDLLSNDAVSISGVGVLSSSRVDCSGSVSNDTNSSSAVLSSASSSSWLEVAGSAETRTSEDSGGRDGGVCGVATAAAITLSGSSAGLGWGNGDDEGESRPSEEPSHPALTARLPKLKLTASELRRGAGRVALLGSGGTESPETQVVRGLERAPPVEMHRFRGFGASPSKGIGEPDLLTGGPLGRPSPCIRFPYNSPRFFAAAAFSVKGDGTPIAKLPRGTGTPPFSSNLAILSRRVPVPAIGMPFEVTWVDGCWFGETLRCWRAAIRSLRLTGGVCAREAIAISGCL